jgi:O-antigen/teichoic acid export membrane protein
MERLKISGKILARNTILNLIGRTLPLIVGIITIPVIVRGLGTERFGLLSLIWVVLGYFTIFDLGLGRATTKYVAEVLGKGETKRVSDIVWTSVTSQAILGIIGTVIVAYSTPLLVERILNISPVLHAEARVTFYVLALSVPIVLISSSFSGVLEATQRFDLINAVKIPTSTLTFLLPVIGLSLNFTLPGIVVLILVARVGACIAFVLLNFRTVPQIRRYSGSLSLVTHLLSFGGWITVSNIVGPLLQYLDRFLIGALLTMSVVAYYTAPFDIMSRLSIIPMSLVMTMFPAFSTLGLSRIDDLRYFFIRSTKYMFLFISLVVLILILFAHEILQVWLGNAFAKDSTLVLQILALGILISSLTHLTLALFQGIGHPDVTAKIQLLLLPVSIFLSIILIKKIGLIGAALSWAISRTLGMLLSWQIASKIIQLNRTILVKNKMIHEFVWFIVFACILSPLLFLNNIYVKVLGTIIAYIVFSFLGWRYILDTLDRSMILSFLNRLLNFGRAVSNMDKKTVSKKI